VVWAVGLLRPYIEGTKFLIQCDHKALKWILPTTSCTNNMLNRWRILLSELDNDVEQGLLNQPFSKNAEYIPLLLTCSRI